jgi:hypothetical protein
MQVRLSAEVILSISYFNELYVIAFEKCDRPLFGLWQLNSPSLGLAGTAPNLIFLGEGVNLMVSGEGHGSKQSWPILTYQPVI